MAPASFEHADVFAIGPISDDATTSDEERALRALLKKPNASEKLSEFVRSASVAGQLYALLGLRLCDRPAFERAVPDFLRRDGIVTTMTGMTSRWQLLRRRPRPYKRTGKLLVAVQTGVEGDVCKR